MRTSKLSFWVFLIALIAFHSPHANATTFDWSYTDGSSNVGSGTLVATPGIGDAYTVTAIAGTANGQAITGLSGYDSPDQQVFSPSPPDIALDTLGISFSVGTNSFNLYEDDGLYASNSPYACGTSVYCLLGPGTAGAGDPVAAVDFSLTPVSEVPLPAAFPLFAAGLGTLGLFGWHRQKMAIVRSA